MKEVKIVLVVCALFSLFGFFSSCENYVENDFYYTDTFLIHVDSIKLSNNISPNIPFEIFFYGTFGSAGCSKFTHFITEKSNNEILIETWGFTESYGSCNDAFVMLNGEKLNYTIEETGNYCKPSVIPVSFS